eukprot:jgi/Phyca11/96237/e_gw1.1.914.1
MASNNPSTRKPSLSRAAFRSGPTSAKAQVPAYDSDGLESDDETLLKLSSLPMMETNHAPRQNEAEHLQEKNLLSSSIVDRSPGCIDVVQQAIDAVEDALARCPKYERREAMTELLMHAKLEQAKKATAYSSDCFQHASVWAAMLMQVQELGRNYPKDPQVHQLVHLVQQCVTRGEKHEQEHNEEIAEEEVQQQEVECDADLCGRLGEAAIDVDLSVEEVDDIGYRITEDMAAVSNQLEEEHSATITKAEEEPLSCDTDAAELKEPSAILHRDDPDAAELEEPANYTLGLPPVVPPRRLRELLPILTGNVVVKGVQVPRLLRGSDGGHSSDSDKSSTSASSRSSSQEAGRNSRHKFQFPEKELLQLLEDEEVNPSAMSPGLLRRYSTASKITATVPLRRKSFSMKKSPLKCPSFVGFGSLTTSASIAASDHGRFSVTKQQIIAFNTKRKSISSSNPASGSPTSSPPVSPVPSTQTQMVLRLRGRTSGGVPKLVIAKKPVRFVVWHWNDRCIRVPFMSAANFMELGPAQHGIMLRQLRYIKSMMHELPWAKAHLRSLLSKYTAKEVTKEELYPQLNALGQQVQREISSRTKQHRALTARKQRLTVTLTVATSLVNDTIVTKFGRRGRPHTSRLLYDPTNPLQLRWRRKHGERSVEFLAVDELEIIEAPDSTKTGSFGRGNKKAAAAVAVDPESCLSLVTPSRSLDLQVASSLHREWLANALRDIVSFAHQYKAAKASTATLSDSDGSSDSSRRQQLPSSRNDLLY